MSGVVSAEGKSGAELILAALPHRHPFLFVDRVEAIEPGKRIVAVKQVAVSEPHFQGHFPEMPLMPGVLMIEALAQACGVLMWLSATRPSAAKRPGCGCWPA